MKELTINDYEEVIPYLDKANYKGYNSNFVTMIMWNHEYHIQYEAHPNFLVMLHHYKGVFFWAMPFCEEEYYKEAIEYMIEYSEKNKFDFIIDCAIEDFVGKIKPIFKDKLLFERTPYNDDYIYDRKRLETLSGKKMQKKRNHYNSFVRDYPNFKYRELDNITDFDMILQCLIRWEKDQGDGLSESITSEIRGIMTLLSYQSQLDFKVAGIFVDGEMEAFTIASMLKHSTIQIHVEKANKEIRGLYPAILKHLLENSYPDALYVNREEDMGLENLRKSKLSLYPIGMIYNYRISLRNLEIRQSKIPDLPNIKQMWLENFTDETHETTDFYFNSIFRFENTYILTDKKTIISALQIVPFKIMKNKKVVESYFILGVCTHKNFEGQGCMKELLTDVLERYKDYPIYLQAYVPAIYKKFGFEDSHFQKMIDVDQTLLSNNNNLEIINDTTVMLDYYEKFVEGKDEYRVRDKHYYALYLKRIEVFDYKYIIFKNHGYIIYEENEERIEVHEFIYLNQQSANDMLAYLKDKDKKMILYSDLGCLIQGEIQMEMNMMSNIKENVLANNKYINEIY